MKIICEITGGLGNQMFQYACGKAIAYRLSAKFLLDLSLLKYSNRTFMLDTFPNIRSVQKYKPSHDSAGFKKIFQRVLQGLGIRYCQHIQEPHYSYWPEIENIQNSVRLSGYWQNEKYFLKISSLIKQDFVFPNFSCTEAEAIAQKIRQSSCSVSIHIRRGDYVQNLAINQVHGICSMEYYEKALQIIVDKNNESLPEIFLFSDDPKWIKSNFNTKGFPFVIIDIPQHKSAPYHDMHLMSLCRHHIIANSSFSWWGAWLSARDGIIVAPKRWFKEETMRQYNPSLPSWITI